ncbi:uncharacterized protein I303_100072 [Kwoniella dejecticola CBS 10117]|uniref:Uncharacterized protein n=1 Tax=Kwoniella dejecticola CBS 10117 TaxID=1296121 RepID=A0A1A6ADW3_9TREE|nr:uncharacterized protein I303_00072 [Kwoniella dejecticola CBS 10117]OBR88261.1 hypothetical protein I303_00072 [Kwoniella dejecticola CBS 10117]
MCNHGDRAMQKVRAVESRPNDKGRNTLWKDRTSRIGLADNGYMKHIVDTTYEYSPGPYDEDDEDFPSDPIPSGPFLGCITKYLSTTTTTSLCIHWGYWEERSRYTDELARLSSGLIRNILRKSPNLKDVYIHIDSKDIDEFGPLDLKLKETEKINVIYQTEKPDIDFGENDPYGFGVAATKLKWRLQAIWDLYRRTYMRFSRPNQTINFMMEKIGQARIQNDLKKVRKTLKEGRDARRFPWLLREFEEFKQCWIYPTENEQVPTESHTSHLRANDGSGASAIPVHLCRCEEIMFHRMATSEWDQWKKPRWAEPKYRDGSFSPDPMKARGYRRPKYGCRCGKCYDSDSECESVLEGWDPAAENVTGDPADIFKLDW